MEVAADIKRVTPQGQSPDSVIRVGRPREYRSVARNVSEIRTRKSAHVREAASNEPAASAVGDYRIHLSDHAWEGLNDLRGMNIDRHAAPSGRPNV